MTSSNLQPTISAVHVENRGTIMGFSCCVLIIQYDGVPTSIKSPVVLRKRPRIHPSCVTSLESELFFQLKTNTVLKATATNFLLFCNSSRAYTGPSITRLDTTWSLPEDRLVTINRLDTTWGQITILNVGTYVSKECQIASFTYIHV